MIDTALFWLDDFLAPLAGTLALLAGFALGLLKRKENARPGALELLRWLYRLGRELHPGRAAKDFKWRAIILLLWFTSFRKLRAWYGISDNPALASALRRFPMMHGMIYGPYINRTWSMERRLHTIDQHYRLLRGRVAIIAAATVGQIELAAFDEKFPGIRLVLDKPEWFLREGEVVLNLFLREQRLMSLAFTLGTESGGLVAYVGALQGTNSGDALEIFRNLTRALHGLRPRDLLVIALKLLCAELRIGKIYAVSGDMRQHRSKYFGGSHEAKVRLDYDRAWIELGGTRLENGFFDIPVPVRYRDTSEIPSRKRANYRRRYQMVDKLARDIRAVIARHEITRAIGD